MGILKTATYISLPILGLCATILYLLHKKEEDELQDTLQDIKTSRFKIIEMKIPKTVIGVVIGRAGSNIKEVQQKTDTKIHFKDQDDNDEYRTCFIKGTAEATQMAEIMLHEFITSQPIIEVRETWVPQTATGRIIGRGGENIRMINRASNAKLNVDSCSSGKTNDGTAKTRIVIKGTSEQIAVALSLIKEKVEEDADVRKNLEYCKRNRSPRNKQKSIPPSPPNTDPVNISDTLKATGSHGYLQVFVSAVVCPNCFWIQVYSKRAVELDHLLQEMMEYYSNEENKALHAVTNPELGQIVAAPFPEDNRLYRAEVRAIDLNENKLDIYYVDFGDSDNLNISDVYQLRTDFLKLGFQAIECTLANVKPSKGDKWDSEAIEEFDKLCHTAQWKPLWAKVESRNGVSCSQKGESPIPCISLYDKVDSKDINIGEELINLGLAAKVDPH